MRRYQDGVESVPESYPTSLASERSPLRIRQYLNQQRPGRYGGGPSTETKTLLWQIETSNTNGRQNFHLHICTQRQHLAALQPYNQPIFFPLLQAFFSSLFLSHTYITMAPLAAELSHLPKTDGSANFAYGGYTITAAVNGPVEAQRRDENPFEALVDVNVRPAAGVGGKQMNAPKHNNKKRVVGS